MAHTKQMERKTNTGLPKATIGRKVGKGGKGSGSGSGSGSGRGSGCAGGGGGVGGSGGGSGGAVGHFSQQLENRPPAAAPKHKKPYIRAFQEMLKLQRTTKLCISKYQMAR